MVLVHRNQFYRRIQLLHRLTINKDKLSLQHRHRYQHWYQQQSLNRRHSNSKILFQVWPFNSQLKFNNSKVFASSMHQHQTFAFYLVVKLFASHHLNQTQHTLDHQSAPLFCDSNRLFLIQQHRLLYPLVSIICILAPKLQHLYRYFDMKTQISNLQNQISTIKKNKIGDKRNNNI